MINHSKIHILVVLAFLALPFLNATATVQDEIDSKNAQIQALQLQIDEYQQQVDTIHGQALTLQGEVDSLNAQINQIILELKSLNLSIGNTNLQINNTQTQITDAETKISKYQDALGQYLRLIYQNDQETLIGILTKNDNLSDFFNELNSINAVQDDLKITIDNIASLETSLQQQKQDLEDKLTDLQKQQNLVAVEKRSLDQAKAQKNTILSQTKGQESKFQQLVRQGKQNIAAIQQEISYLLQNGVTVEDAIKYGNLAAIATGIRPAFLLAELNLESAILNPNGSNVGKCYLRNFNNGDGVHVDTNEAKRRVMSPSRDITPFLSITNSLGLDPSATRISCWPGTYYHGQPYGWGGAMGPGQFIASTWLGYEDKVASLTGRSPANPWNIEDAFTASAIKLAKDGADSKTKSGEVAASKRYYCGSATSTSSGCINYANRVQQMADQIEADL